jgi:hypothetical protein
MRKSSRLIVLFLSLSTLFPVAASSDDLGPAQVPDHWCTPNKVDGCEAHSFAAFAPYARRINRTTLALTLRTGRKVTLSNPNDCYSTNHFVGEGCEHFSLDFYFRKRGFFLIGIGRYEWAEWALLNDRTGRQTRLFGPPIFSPSGREFVVAINQSQASGIQAAFEVWSLRSSAPMRSFRFEPGVYPFEGNASWRGNDRIALSYNSFPFGGPVVDHIQIDTAVRQRGGWWLEPRERPVTIQDPWLSFHPAENGMKAAVWELLDLGIVQLHAARLMLRKYQVDPYPARHRIWLSYERLDASCRVVGLDPALPGFLEIWLETDGGNLAMTAPISLDVPGPQPTQPREIEFDASEASHATIVLRGRCA